MAQTNLLLFVWPIVLLLFIKTLGLFDGKANWFLVIRHNSVTFVIIVKTKTGPQGGIYLIKLWDTIADSSENTNWDINLRLTVSQNSGKTVENLRQTPTFTFKLLLLFLL